MDPNSTSFTELNKEFSATTSRRSTQLTTLKTKDILPTLQTILKFRRKIAY